MPISNRTVLALIVALTAFGGCATPPPPPAQGLHGLHAPAAHGLHAPHFFAAQGLHGLQAAAHGLHLAAAHCAIAGATLTRSVRTAPPAAIPARTTNGTIVVDRSIRFLDCIQPLPTWAFFVAPPNMAKGPEMIVRMNRIYSSCVPSCLWNQRFSRFCDDFPRIN